jgi:hypothetical protein
VFSTYAVPRTAESTPSDRRGGARGVSRAGEVFGLGDTCRGMLVGDKLSGDEESGIQSWSSFSALTPAIYE